MLLIAGLIVLGIVAGALAGIIGVGSGIIVITALVYLFGFSQKLAQGTTLALTVAPAGIFAAWVYYKAGHVDLKAAVLIVLGFVVGSYFSSSLAVHIPDKQLARFFGLFLVVVGLKMLISK